MWHTGKYQFIPFIATVIAVVLTDLLKGCRNWFGSKYHFHPEEVI
jgi:hypothetical protein